MKEPFGKYIDVIYRHQQILINHHLKSYNMSSGQYVFLLNIHDNKGISQKELSKLIKIDKATTAKALKKLEENGYIHRLVDKEDRRYNRLYLTDKGIEFIPTLIEILDKITETLIVGVGNEQYDETLEVLKLILNNVQASVKILKQ
jgi:DNA-binding MarR family transcriptional regulator